MLRDYEEFMQVALAEAKLSLKEGNNGFGAVIVKGKRIMAQSHDKEESQADPTSHAELNAIRLFSRKYGRDFADCVLISTHEPCPMCATAIIWSGIKTLVYGYSITEALAEGRKRIDLTCADLFARAKANITVHSGILHDQCSLLYRRDVRDEIKKLRGASKKSLESLRKLLTDKRTQWYRKYQTELALSNQDLVLNGYELLLKKLEIKPEEAPIASHTGSQVVFHSKNFCPTLEACKILDLDTRRICRLVNEQPTDSLLKQLDSRLEFGRNYDKLRPYCDYCEEMVTLKA